MAGSSNTGLPFARRRPELPGFCRSRYQDMVTVERSRLRRLERLLWLGMLYQLTTLLLLVVQLQGAGQR